MNEAGVTQIASTGSEIAAPLAKPAELPSFDARARWKTFMPLIVAFSILNLSPAISRLAGYEPGDTSWRSIPRWQTWLVAGWGIEATLLAIWLALAPVRASERLALIGLTYLVWKMAALIGIVALFWLSRVEVQLFFPMTLLELSYFASLAVALGAFRYFRGWQLTGADWSGPLPPGRFLRFGLLQLLLFTTGLAGYMAICKVSEITGAVLLALGCGLAVAPVVVATLWLVLATARTRLTILAATVGLIVATALVFQFADFRVARTGPHVAIAILAWYSTLVLSLAWFRVGGWRLTHERSTRARGESRSTHPDPVSDPIRA